jgi:CheY-like chemotaxis protein
MANAQVSILVVEDEALIAAMLQEMLEGLGARVIGPAYTLDLGCELAATAACDAAVLDVSIRGETVAPVAQILFQRGVPFILATGYGGDLSQTWPDAPVIEKPYSIADLWRALAAIGVEVASDQQGAGGSGLPS